MVVSGFVEFRRTKAIRMRAKRTSIVSQKARHIVRLAQILRYAKDACSG